MTTFFFDSNYQHWFVSRNYPIIETSIILPTKVKAKRMWNSSIRWCRAGGYTSFVTWNNVAIINYYMNGKENKKMEETMSLDPLINTNIESLVLLGLACSSLFQLIKYILVSFFFFLSRIYISIFISLLINLIHFEVMTWL